MRLRRNLTFSAGVRYEAQTHVGDYNGLMPRLGVTWAPFKSGATTLRTSWGIFHDWLPDQYLRADACAWTASTSRRWTSSTRLAARTNSGLGAGPAIATCWAKACAAAHDARQCRHRSALPGRCRRARRTPTRAAALFARSQPQCAGERRAARSAVRQHHRSGVRRPLAAARSAGRDDRQPRRAIPGSQTHHSSDGSA